MGVPHWSTPRSTADAGILALLLESGADLANVGGDGWNVLHVAAKLGRMDMVEALIAAGADTQAQTPGGDDALRLALASPRQDLDLIRFLRQNTDTPDTLALAARVGDVAAIRALIADGAAVDVRHEDGQTALQVAAASDQPSAVRALLAAGANPAVESAAGRSPLVAAAAAGHLDTAAILIDHGGSTAAQRTAALYQANLNASPDLVRALLRDGADPLVHTGQDPTPLAFALEYGNQALIDAYVEQGHVLTVAAAARLGHIEGLTQLLEGGVDPHQASPDGHSPLELAIRNDQLETLQVLLDHGVAADAQLPTWDRRRPLHEAATNENSELVTLLLNRGADPNRTDRVGRTPLYYAVTHGHEQSAQALLESGADPNLAPSGEALLKIASQDSMRMLLESHGARSSPDTRHD